MNKFREVVNGCPVPAIMVGGSGVAIGRNSFHNEDMTEFVKKVYGIVHGSIKQ